MSTEQELDNLFPEGYVGLRAGLREHITGGRFQGYDLGIYVHLHFFASWRTGICFTNAVAIGNELDIPVRSVNNSLARLKERGYINFRKGDGRHGSYPIYIHKHRPTVGALKGYELNAFASNNKETVLYISPDGHGVEAAWKKRGDGADEALMRHGDGVLVARIEEDNTIRREDGKDEKKEKRSLGTAGAK
jgi:hypothetical protein